MKNSSVLALATIMAALPVGAQNKPPNGIPLGLQSGLDTIQAGNLRKHVEILASDEFEGRGPGTQGEDKTVEYLIDQFQAAGAGPGNPNGTYVQKVPLTGYVSKPKIDLTVNGQAVSFVFPEDFVHDYPQLVEKVSIPSAPIVFAGYGITASQFGWDDYKGRNVRGKLVLVLSGEPTKVNDSVGKKPDPAFFAGGLRTYYSTREYKYEEARRRGAAGILVIYDPAAANTYSLFSTFAKIEGQNLKPALGNHQLAIAGLTTTGAVSRVLASAGRDFAELQRASNSATFRPVVLDGKARITIESKLRSFNSSNVVAKVVGSDPLLRKEYVVYTAHWDHLGKDLSLEGDQIYNGANDNAIGVAQLIELARAFASSKQKPGRSVLFIATTAEEKGYLGARYYVRNPLYPLASTAANINLDAGNMFGLTSDVGSSGNGRSTLDQILDRAAGMQGRVFAKESLDSTGGMYFASDQIEFAKAGIPAVFPWSGFDYVGKPKDFGEKAWDDYSANRYHKVTDGVRADWDFAGAVEDTKWFAITGYLVGQERKRPQWYTTAEFGRTSRSGAGSRK